MEELGLSFMAAGFDSFLEEQARNENTLLDESSVPLRILIMKHGNGAIIRIIDIIKQLIAFLMKDILSVV